MLAALRPSRTPTRRISRRPGHRSGDPAAQSLDRSAALCGITIYQTTDGTVPVPADTKVGGTMPSLSFRFTGKGGKGFNVVAMPGRLLVYGVDCLRPVPAPGCSARAAYAAGVAADMPRAASLFMDYHYDENEGAATWGMMTNAGRSVRLDGRTCRKK